MNFFGRTDLYPISLGFNCHVTVFIERLGDKDHRFYERQPFDWIGTPMWSITELISNSFADLCKRECIELRQRFVKQPSAFLTNTKYNVAFVHDYGKNPTSISTEKWNEVQMKYDRRISRWNATLASRRPLLFIRLEESPLERVKYPDSTREQDEFHYVKVFSKQMQEKKVKFVVLYLSTTLPTQFDAEYSICVISFKKTSPDVIVSGDHIFAILKANHAFIQKTLRSITFV